MDGYSSNIREVAEAIRAHKRNAVAIVEKLPGRICQEADAHIHELTPVHSGKTVRNMVWTIGEPNETEFEAIDNGEPGDTAHMAIGEEPRRPPNEAAAKATLIALLSGGGEPFTNWWLSNNNKYVARIEAGEIPKSPRPPSPHMFLQTANFVTSKMKALLG